MTDGSWLFQLFVLINCCILQTYSFGIKEIPTTMNNRTRNNALHFISGDNGHHSTTSSTTSNSIRIRKMPTFYEDGSAGGSSLKSTISSNTDTALTRIPPPLLHKRNQRKQGGGRMTEEKSSSSPTSSRDNNTNIGLSDFLESTRALIIDAAIIKVLNRRSTQVVTLVDIGWLKTHEEVLVDRVTNLKKAIEGWNEYRMPLLVDVQSGAILDGHHRYHVGRELGLTKLPVVLVDYLEDDTIDVDVWPECGIDCLSKEDVINMSLSDKVFPPKTSKHGFVSEMNPINIPLTHLMTK